MMLNLLIWPTMAYIINFCYYFFSSLYFLKKIYIIFLFLHLTYLYHLFFYSFVIFFFNVFFFTLFVLKNVLTRTKKIVFYRSNCNIILFFNYVKN